MAQEESKTEYRKTGPAMSRLRTLAQPSLDGERPGPSTNPYQSTILN